MDYRTAPPGSAGVPPASLLSFFSLLAREQKTELASVVRQADATLSRRWRARLTFSKMSEAFAVQMNGLGSKLCCSMALRIVASS